MLSATRDPEILLPCFEAGCHDYILKTEGFEQAVDRLEYWIRSYLYDMPELESRKEKVISALKRESK